MFKIFYSPFQLTRSVNHHQTKLLNTNTLDISCMVGQKFLKSLLGRKLYIFFSVKEKHCPQDTHYLLRIHSMIFVQHTVSLQDFFFHFLFLPDETISVKLQHSFLDFCHLTNFSNIIVGDLSTDSNSLAKILKMILNTFPRILVQEIQFILYLINLSCWKNSINSINE